MTNNTSPLLRLTRNVNVNIECFKSVDADHVYVYLFKLQKRKHVIYYNILQTFFVSGNIDKLLIIVVIYLQ